MGNVVAETSEREHISENVQAKRVGNYVWDSVNLQWVRQRGDSTGAVAITGTVTTTPSGTQNVDVVGNTIGLATGTKQDTGNTSLSSIDGKIPASPSQEHTTAASPHSTRLSDGSSFYKATTPLDTQPVSGTVTANQGTAQTASSGWPIRVSDGTNLVNVGDNANSAVRVNIVTGAAGVSQVDKTAFTEGASSFAPVGGVVNDTPSSDPTEDQAAAARITVKRAIHINLRNVSGTEVGTASAPVRVDPTGSTTQPVSGTVSAAQSGTWTVQPGNTPNTSPWLITQIPETSGGLLIYRNLDTNATGANIKSSAGQVFGWYLANNATAERYIKLYNKSSAPSVGSDTPVITLLIPGKSAAVIEFVNGIAFSSGIGIGATTGVADANSTSPGTNQVVSNIFYK